MDKQAYLYVINLKTGNILWKEKIISNKWSFVVNGKKHFYVDIGGMLKNVNYITKTSQWRIKLDKKFINSTRPVINENDLYICNDTQVVALEIKDLEVIHNFSTQNKIVSCCFNDDIASILTKNDDLYSIDLENSKMRWVYKYVTLFSKTLIITLPGDYSGTNK